MKTKALNIDRLSIRTLAIIFVEFLLYLLLGGLILGILYLIYHTKTYDYTDSTYRIAQLFKTGMSGWIGAYALIGFLGITYYNVRKIYRQMGEIVTAVETVYKGNDSITNLSPELSEVSIELERLQLKLQIDERAAKEAEQRKNDLIVYLAHDLKTPLTSVIGYLSLLNEETEISEELRQKYLSVVLDKSFRLEDLINEFFDITRFNLTTLVMEPSNVNLSMMLEQLYYEFLPMLSEKNLELDFHYPKHLNFYCDAEKIQRVFDNLLRNALNYSYPDSKITLKVWIDHAPDTFSTPNQVSTLCIDISNHGQTIPPEKLEHLFEQFYRVDSSRSTKSGGSGLGLAISKEIIQLHNGKIRAESSKETIVFHICFPYSTTQS